MKKSKTIVLSLILLAAASCSDNPRTKANEDKEKQARPATVIWSGGSGYSTWGGRSAGYVASRGWSGGSGRSSVGYSSARRGGFGSTAAGGRGVSA